MQIVRASPADAPVAEALLAAAGLPVDGAADALSLRIVARDGNEIVAAAAVERYGAAGPLRSVVVEDGRRGTGLERQIVTAVGDSIAFTMVCRDTGVAMRRTIA